MKGKRKKIVACISILAIATAGCGSTEGSNIEENTTEVFEIETETIAEETEAVIEAATEIIETETEIETESETESVIETEAVESTTEQSDTETTASETIDYTYTDMSAVMYAKSSVRVRDLPSTDGTKLGELSTNQEVNVTGTCNETGWYRIDFKGVTGYVSSKYIVAEKVAVPEETTEPAQTSTNDNSNIVEAEEPATSTTVTEVSSETQGGSQVIDEFDRAAGEQIFANINAERVENGLAPLAWSEDLYKVACERCDENDVHEGARPGIAENYARIIWSYYTADQIHNGFHDSSVHHDNYMSDYYVSGAVAVKRSHADNGYNEAVCYEVFTL